LNDELIEFIRQMEAHHKPETLFNEGDSVEITDGPFAGIRGIFKMKDGDSRGVVLMEIICQPSLLRFNLDALKRVS
ncbi:MAG TPA: hypothetical protein VFM18_04175, partial [Methanosarcina sp.]|nr:hypothetical protein [Methanosarcina sp.]